MSILSLHSNNGNTHCLNANAIKDIAPAIDVQQSRHCHMFDFSRYEVVYFTCYKDFDQIGMGNALYDFVHLGGILVCIPHTHSLESSIIKGAIQPFMPIKSSAGKTGNNSRTFGKSYDTPYSCIVDGVEGEIKAQHITDISIANEECVLVADTADGKPLVAISELGEGLIIYVNAMACTSGSNGDAVSKKLVRSALTFGIRFACNTERKVTSSLIVSSEEKSIRVQIDEEMIIHTDSATARRCSIVLADMMEGDAKALVYCIKIPCLKCAELVAFFLRTGKLPIGRIKPSSVVSLLKAGEYLQADLIIQSVSNYFRGIHNARKIIKFDADFSRKQVSIEQLIRLLPVSIESTYENSSPWKEIFLHWVSNIDSSV